MKKIIYLSGIISVNLMMFGSFFKIMKWPFASVFLIGAVCIFCFFFLPTALVSCYRSKTDQKYKLLSLVTFIVFFLGVASILFKIQHWPFGGILMNISLPLPFILFLPIYFYETRNEKNNRSLIPIMLGLTFLAVFSALLVLH